MTRRPFEPALAHEPVRSDSSDGVDELYVPILWDRDGPAPQDERDMFFTKELVTCAP